MMSDVGKHLGMMEILEKLVGQTHWYERGESYHSVSLLFFTASFSFLVYILRFVSIAS